MKEITRFATTLCAVFLVSIKTFGSEPPTFTKLLIVEYTYDEAGNRISKVVKPPIKWPITKLDNFVNSQTDGTETLSAINDSTSVSIALPSTTPTPKPNRPRP